VLEGGKPTYRAIVANTWFDARTEKRSVVKIAAFVSRLDHLILNYSICGGRLCPSSYPVHGLSLSHVAWPERTIRRHHTPTQKIAN
jgi:hypothetical protein